MKRNEPSWNGVPDGVSTQWCHGLCSSCEITVSPPCGYTFTSLCDITVTAWCEPIVMSWCELNVWDQCELTMRLHFYITVISRCDMVWYHSEIMFWAQSDVMVWAHCVRSLWVHYEVTFTSQWYQGVILQAYNSVSSQWCHGVTSCVSSLNLLWGYSEISHVSLMWGT